MTQHDDRYAAPAAAASPTEAPGVATPMFNRAAWLRILPFAAYMLFIVIADVLERLGVAPGPLRWLYPVKIGVVALLLALFWRQYDELKGLRLPAALTAIAVGVVVLVLWVSLDADWMSVGS